MKKFLSIVLLLAVGLLQAVGNPCDWPRYGHDDSNTQTNPCETILSPSTVPNLKLKWIAPGANPLANGVYAAPIISNGVLYYGDSGGYFYARDAETGLDLFPPLLVNGSIDAPATVSNGVVYFTVVPATANPIQLYAVNVSNFEVVTGFPVNVGGSPSSLPTANGITAEVLSGVVVAGKAQDILIVAVTNSGQEESATLLPTNRGGFVAYDLQGNIKWTLVVNEPPLGAGAGSWSTAAVDNDLGLIFVGTAQATTPPAGPYTDALLAIDYNTGTIKWHRQYTKDDVYSSLYPCGLDFDLGASPNLFTICKNGKKIDVVGVNNKAGCYRVWKRTNGKPVWFSPVIPNGTEGSINGNSGAAYANDTVYTCCNQSNATVPVGPLNIIAFYGIYVCDNFEALLFLLQQSFLTDQTYIRAHCAKTGKVKWSINQPPATAPAITQANGVLYTGNFVGLFRAINAADGSLLFEDTPVKSPIPGLGPIISGPVTIANGRVYISIYPSLAPVAGGVAMYSL